MDIQLYIYFAANKANTYSLTRRALVVIVYTVSSQK